MLATWKVANPALIIALAGNQLEIPSNFSGLPDSEESHSTLTAVLDRWLGTGGLSGRSPSRVWGEKFLLEFLLRSLWVLEQKGMERLMSAGLKELAARFMTHRHMLTAFVEGFVRDPAAAEDIFQEVWIRLAEAAEKGEVIEDMARWSRGVAKNLILHYWRDKRGAKETPDSRLINLAELAFSEQDAASDHWASKRLALVKCMEDLPAHAHELLRMKYDDALSIAEIGRRLKRSLGGVMVSLTRLRHVLVECVERKLKIIGSDA